jgi:ElaB/YqjD/DUF883 family membrane-anchored ribosome-binding protein
VEGSRLAAIHRENMSLRSLMTPSDPSGKSASPSSPLSHAADEISGGVTSAKKTVADLGRHAAQTIDDHRSAAASGLDSAASTLRAGADHLPGGDKVSHLAQDAADTLTTTADYVRRHDVNDMVTDVERFVKKNPGPSLLAAVALGFLVGRSFSHNS